MSMAKFCPKCGREKEDLVHGFCMDCYREDHPLLNMEARLLLPICEVCGKVKIRGKWEKATDDVLGAFGSRKLRVKEVAVKQIVPRVAHLSNGDAELSLLVQGMLDHHPFRESVHTLLKMERGFCDACMKMRSDYYECIVQLRFPKGKREAEILAIMDEFGQLLEEQRGKDALAQIAKVEKKGSAIDLWIGSKQAAKKIADRMGKKYGAELKTSHKIKKGRTSTGKPKKKFTYLIRFGD